MTSILQKTYKEKMIPSLMKELGVKNIHAVPKIMAVQINVGIGSAVVAGKDPEEIVKNIALISGQKPVVVHSKKAISNFKLKINMASGVVVTLRGKRMYDFITKLINIVFPRIRDFRGISKKSFDGHGNYSIGIQEHIAFPEIQSDDITKTHGIQITIQTNSGTNERGFALLKEFGFPFMK